MARKTFLFLFFKKQSTLPIHGVLMSNDETQIKQAIGTAYQQVGLALAAHRAGRPHHW